MFWLLTGSIPGVLLSSQFTPHVPDRVLRLGLASVLMLSGIKLIDFSGADYVIAGGRDRRGARVRRLGPASRAPVGVAVASRRPPRSI